MRLTIICVSIRLVIDVLDDPNGINLQQFSDYLAQYIDDDYIWCVTPHNQMPCSFAHNRHGQYAL